MNISFFILYNSALLCENKQTNNTPHTPRNPKPTRTTKPPPIPLLSAAGRLCSVLQDAED